MTPQSQTGPRSATETCAGTSGPLRLQLTRGFARVLTLFSDIVDENDSCSHCNRPNSRRLVILPHYRPHCQTTPSYTGSSRQELTSLALFQHSFYFCFPPEGHLHLGHSTSSNLNWSLKPPHLGTSPHQDKTPNQPQLNNPNAIKPWPLGGKGK